MFFSKRATSNFPTFSIAPSISLIGLPTRNKPFSNILPNADALDRHTVKALSNFPAIILLFTCGSKLLSNLRSEEHTSELQSRFDLVCRLLLEKKKYIANQR